MTDPASAPTTDACTVLTRAVLRASDRLDVSKSALCEILGISAASGSRLGRGRVIEPQSKEGELALLFVRAFRSLDSLVGGDEGAARAWFHADNYHLSGTPAQLVRKVDGLVHVVEYLDAMRGR